MRTEPDMMMTRIVLANHITFVEWKTRQQWHMGWLPGNSMLVGQYDRLVVSHSVILTLF